MSLDNENPQPTAESPAEAEINTRKIEETPAAEPLSSAGTQPPAAEQAAEPAAVRVAEATGEGEGVSAAAEAAEPVEVTTAEGAETAYPEEMSKLIDEYTAPPQQREEGQILEGKVVAVSELGVVVDVGLKKESLIPAQEFAELEGGPPFAPGDAIEVQLTSDEREGYQVVSWQRAHRKRVWAAIDRSYKSHDPLAGRVVDRIKGGLVVDIGVRAFLPASQVELRHTHDLDAWKEREIQVRVMKLNRKRGNVVVSRRAVLEDEQKARREQLLESLHEGQVLAGRVKNLTDYGAFVDLGGVDGLLHITDLSWGRLAKPAEALSVGQEIEVKVLRFDKEKGRISLGRKQLMPDPWLSIPERCPRGTRLKGVVKSITDYGAFVEIEPGVEGLVHVSEMSWSKRTRHPSKIVAVGAEVEVAVLDVKPESRRISLGLKQLTEDPWVALAEKYPVGSVVKGRVRNLTDFGAFVEIEEGFDGLIHVSDIRWNERIRHPSEVFKKGDIVEAKVLKLDHENRRLSLGIKQLNDIWANWFAAHKVEEILRGKVTRATSFGVFVELAEGIEGLCHISEIESRRGKDKDKDRPRKDGLSQTTLETGKEYDFKIVKLNPEQHKIGLSYRAAQQHAERKEMQDYRAAKASPAATIGDMIMAKRNTG